MVNTRIVLTYSFDELNDKAKARARDWFREGVTSGWWEFDDIVECAKRLGIEIETRVTKTTKGRVFEETAIDFQLSYSQGDYAAFEGTWKWSAKPETEGVPYRSFAAAINEYAPMDSTLMAIAAQLDSCTGDAAIVKSEHNRYFPRFNTMRENDEITDAEHPGTVKDALQKFERWMYDNIRGQYESINSDENVDDTIRANEYEFTSNGKIYPYNLGE